MKLRITTLFLTFTSIILGIFILFFVISMAFIYNSVSKSCHSFMEEFGGDCVEASLSALEADHVSTRKKNTAIYVLGQLADDRALPYLKSLYSGTPDYKEPLDEVISQYEIAKAIKWCEKGNITHFMYKKLKN